jgi:type II secretory pathway pseudopilin PulG
VALVTVLVVLASIAVLMAGVFSLVSEGTRSAREEVEFQTTRSLSAGGLQQSEHIIDAVCRLGFFPPAPSGAGVLVNATANDGQWNSRQDFGDYLRGSVTRADGDGPDPCTQANPDLQYQVNTSSGAIEVRACIFHRDKSSIAGTGSGPVFARTSQGLAAKQNLYELTVWASGPSELMGQYQAVARDFTAN